MKVACVVVLVACLAAAILATDDNVAMESEVDYQKVKPLRVFAEPEGYVRPKKYMRPKGELTKRKASADEEEVPRQRIIKYIHVPDQSAYEEASPSQQYETYAANDVQYRAAHGPPGSFLSHIKENMNDGKVLGFSSFVEHFSESDDAEELKTAMREGSMDDIKRLVPKSGISFQMYHGKEEEMAVDAEPSHSTGHKLETSWNKLNEWHRPSAIRAAAAAAYESTEAVTPAYKPPETVRTVAYRPVEKVAYKAPEAVHAVAYNAPERVPGVRYRAPETVAHKRPQRVKTVRYKPPETVQTVAYKLPETAKTVAYKAPETVHTVTYKPPEAVQTVGYKLPETVQTVAYKAPETVHAVAYKPPETVHAVGYKPTEAVQTVGYKLPETVQTVAYKSPETVQTVTFKSPETVHTVGYKLPETVQTVAYKSPETVQTVGYKLPETVQTVAYKSPETVHTVGYKLPETVQTVAYKSPETVQTVGYKLPETVHTVEYKSPETVQTVEYKLPEAGHNVGYKLPETVEYKHLEPVPTVTYKPPESASSKPKRKRLRKPVAGGKDHHRQVIHRYPVYAGEAEHTTPDAADDNYPQIVRSISFQIPSEAFDSDVPSGKGEWKGTGGQKVVEYYRATTPKPTEVYFAGGGEDAGRIAAGELPKMGRIIVEQRQEKFAKESDRYANAESSLEPATPPEAVAYHIIKKPLRVQNHQARPEIPPEDYATKHERRPTKPEAVQIERPGYGKETGSNIYLTKDFQNEISHYFGSSGVGSGDWIPSTHIRYDSSPHASEAEVVYVTSPPEDASAEASDATQAKRLRKPGSRSERTMGANQKRIVFLGPEKDDAQQEFSVSASYKIDRNRKSGQQ